MKRSHISYSQLNTFKTCKRMWRYRYINKYKNDEFNKNLSYGSALHKGLEYLYKTGEINVAMETAYNYINGLDMSNMPEGKDETQEHNWMIAVATAHLLGYYEKYYLKDIENEYLLVESEKRYQLPITNPNTNRKSRNYEYQFVGDLVLEKDNKLLPFEFKTASKVDDTYLTKLKIDTQPTGNMLYLSDIYDQEIREYVYRVMKKPAIRLKKNETIDEFSQRLIDTITSNPDDYFHEVLVTRTNDDLDEFRYELWEVQKELHTTVTNNIYVKNTNLCSNIYGKACQYIDICAKNEGWEDKFIKKEKK